MTDSQFNQTSFKGSMKNLDIMTLRYYCFNRDSNLNKYPLLLLANLLLFSLSESRQNCHPHHLIASL